MPCFLPPTLLPIMQTDTTEDAYDWDKLRNDIIIYQNELEKCDKNFEEMAHKAYSTAEMVESSDYLADCCQALAEKIIDEQYSKRAEDHKKALSAYIQAAYDISNIIYQTADVCYPRCGTMFIVIGNNTAAHKARTIVEDYIRALDALANL
ncbi:MAG: hypothetical protein BHW58_06145 [Azospirillum sp. 51_20]|nr:MAG: hypothetical protein BHW58_06145 [Azospirillum sp. 51_20]